MRALHNGLARTGVRNSLFLSFGSTLMDVLLGVGIALVLVRRRFQGSGLLDALAMMPLAVPGRPSGVRIRSRVKRHTSSIHGAIHSRCS